MVSILPLKVYFDARFISRDDKALTSHFGFPCRFRYPSVKSFQKLRFLTKYVVANRFAILDVITKHNHAKKFISKSFVSSLWLPFWSSGYHIDNKHLTSWIRNRQGLLAPVNDSLCSYRYQPFLIHHMSTCLQSREAFNLIVKYLASKYLYFNCLDSVKYEYHHKHPKRHCVQTGNHTSLCGSHLL